MRPARTAQARAEIRRAGNAWRAATAVVEKLEARFARAERDARDADHHWQRWEAEVDAFTTIEELERARDLVGDAKRDLIDALRRHGCLDETRTERE